MNVNKVNSKHAVYNIYYGMVTMVNRGQIREILIDRRLLMDSDKH